MNKNNTTRYIVPYWFIAIIAIMAGCAINTQNSNLELMNILSELHESIDKDKAILFQESTIDSCGNNLYSFAKELGREPLSFEISDDLKMHLDSSLIYYENVEMIFTLIAFHNYLNRKLINRDSIISLIRQIRECRWYEYVKEYRSERLKIALENDFRVEIKDTIKIILPVGIVFESQSTFYFPMGFPYKNGYPKGTDSLEIIGIVVNKEHDLSYNITNTSDSLIYFLKILDIARDDILISNKKLGIGDTMKLNLIDYGRLITKK